MRSLIAHPPAKREQRLIDRLVRHTHLQIVGIVADQPCSDVLRGPSQSQSPLHAAPKPRRGDQLRDLRAVRAPVGRLICAPCAMPLAMAGSRDVARHGRRGPTEASRDHAARVAREQPARDLFPLRERQPQRRLGRRPGLHPTGLDQQSLHGLRGTPQRRRRHLMRLTRSHTKLELQPLRARQPMRPVILGETSCEW
jgi:hypothetical protein